MDVKLVTLELTFLFAIEESFSADEYVACRVIIITTQRRIAIIIVEREVVTTFFR